MKVLIVENNRRLGGLWARHLGHPTTVVQSQSDAVEALRSQDFDILILNLKLHDGSTMAVADFANYRRPDIKVIFVTADTFFSDGSVFEILGNACAMVPPETPPADMVAIVEYHAAA